MLLSIINILSKEQMAIDTKRVYNQLIIHTTSIDKEFEFTYDIKVINIVRMVIIIFNLDGMSLAILNHVFIT